MAAIVHLGGVDLSEVNLSAGDVLSGKKFINSNGDLVTGTAKSYSQAYNEGKSAAASGLYYGGYGTVYSGGSQSNNYNNTFFTYYGNGTENSTARAILSSVGLNPTSVPGAVQYQDGPASGPFYTIRKQVTTRSSSAILALPTTIYGMYNTNEGEGVISVTSSGYGGASRGVGKSGEMRLTAHTAADLGIQNSMLCGTCVQGVTGDSRGYVYGKWYVAYDGSNIYMICIGTGTGSYYDPYNAGRSMPWSVSADWVSQKYIAVG